MKSIFGVLVFVFALVVGSSYAWLHIRHAMKAAAPAPQHEQEKPPSYAEEQEARGTVNLHGPLLDYVSRTGTPQVETLQYVPRKPATTDHVGNSVTGSTLKILQQSFQLTRAVQVAFEVPAHAATPKLCGSYHSSLKQEPRNGDADADVEFLVLNAQQYAEFLRGRSGSATFSADGAHDQEVDTSLPPTFGTSAEYHLVFRNNSKNAGSKMVQADFRIDF